MTQEEFGKSKEISEDNKINVENLEIIRMETKIEQVVLMVYSHPDGN